MGALRIGGYEVDSLLGPGGVTETYKVCRVEPPDADRKGLALKLLRDDRGGDDPVVLAAFAAAAARAADLNEDGLVPVVEVPSPTADPSFMICELVAGVDLAQLLENAGGKTVEPALAGALVAEVARTLASLHDREESVAHGGLAPGNILISGEGRVLLADVGIAAALRPCTDGGIEKWWFVAPELLDPNATPTAASDLYSLGACLFFLLTGRAPFEAETREELKAQSGAGVTEWPAVPEWLLKPLRSLLAVKPTQRPRSAASLALSLAKQAPLAPRLGDLRALARPPLADNGSDFVKRATMTGLPVLSDLVPGGAYGGGPVHNGMGLQPLVPVTLPSAATGALAEVLSGDSLYEGVAALGVGLPTPTLGTVGDAILDLPMMNQSRVELPDLIDRPTDHLSFNGPSPLANSWQGVRPVDENAGPGAGAGAIGLVEEPDDAGDSRSNTPGDRKTAAVALPRMSGSARAPDKKASTSIALGVLALVVVGGAALGAVRLMHDVGERASVPTQPAAPPAVAPPITGPTRPMEASAVNKAAGRLTVATNPSGAIVWIDGEERGRTPLTLQTKPGGHKVVITKAGFKMQREVADTTDGQILNRTLSPASSNFGGTAALKVQCKTADKYPIFIDGRDTGLLCPVEDLLIPEGNRLIGLFVIPQNKLWSFEREIAPGTKQHKVTFNY